MHLKPILDARFPYSYEEFAGHLRAMKTVREWEFTSRFGYVGQSQTTQANTSRVIEYFTDSYTNPAEALHKAEMFLSISDYLVRYAEVFGKRKLIDREADGSMSVDSALLRAVHYLFTSVSRPAEVEAGKVMDLARAIGELKIGK
jgi:hypothetical protein